MWAQFFLSFLETFLYLFVMISGAQKNIYLPYDEYFLGLKWCYWQESTYHSKIFCIHIQHSCVVLVPYLWGVFLGAQNFEHKAIPYSICHIIRPRQRQIIALCFDFYIDKKTKSHFTAHICWTLWWMLSKVLCCHISCPYHYLKIR